MTEASLAKERISKGPEHPDHLGFVAMKAQLEKALDERVQGILRGLELQVAAMKAQLDSADLGLGLCAAGLATGFCGLVVRGSARPPKL